MNQDNFFQIEGISYSREVTNIIKATIGYCKANSYKVMRVEDMLVGIALKGVKTKKILNDEGIDIYTLKDIFSYKKRKRETVNDIEVALITAIIDSNIDGLVAEMNLLASIIKVNYISSKINQYFYDKFGEYDKVNKIVSQLTFKSLAETLAESKAQAYPKIIREEKIEFCTDMSYKAYVGKYQRAIGRESEIRRIEEILQKKKKKNPILVGKPGVGKTAIIEELCNEIVTGKIPSLSDKKIIALNQFELLAGSKYRGDFEDRINKVISKIISRDDIIVFIDEIHYMAKIGKNEGSTSALDILKTYLVNGEISLIGTTTFEDYRKNIEKDPAFDRRFVRVVIEEPSLEETENILAGIIPSYEAEYGIKVEKEEIKYLVSAADRYLSYRAFPDKAVDVIEEAFSKTYVRYMNSIEFNLNPKVTRMVINEVISEMSQVPISSIEKSEINKVISLPKVLSEKVIGQTNAIKTVSDLLKISRAGIGDPNKPVSFLFYGPTGVGKTMLAKVMAEELFGDSKDLIRFDMSEYSDKSSANKFIGSAPGYVGYEDSGTLVKEVRNHPYSILLFDEIEKAHPEIFNIFLQILDDGRLTNASGQTIDFKNTIIIMTSNLGYSNDKSKICGFNKLESNEDYISQNEIGIKNLEKTFRPEFINRIDEIVLFEQLKPDSMEKIAENLMEEFKKQALISGIEISYDHDVIEYLAKNGYDVKYGARPIKRFLEKKIKLKIADIIIQDKGKAVHIHVQDDEIKIASKETVCM